MPKNQSTAAKKARAAQSAGGGKHTQLLRAKKARRPEVGQLVIAESSVWLHPHLWLAVVEAVDAEGRITHIENHNHEIERVSALEETLDEMHVVKPFDRAHVLAAMLLARKRANALAKDWRSMEEVLEALKALRCGLRLDPFGVLEPTCVRPPHDSWEPCSGDRDFDLAAHRAREAAEMAAEQDRQAALTPEERAEEERLTFEAEHDDGWTASDEYEAMRVYKWEA